jgi:hypothetical protein
MSVKFADRLKAIMLLEDVQNQVEGPFLKQALLELVDSLVSEKDLAAKALMQGIYQDYIFNDQGDCTLNFKQAKRINRAAELCAL